MPRSRPNPTPDFGQNRPNPGFRPCSGPEKIDGNRFFRPKLFFPGSSSPSPGRMPGRNPDSERSILGLLTTISHFLLPATLAIFDPRPPLGVEVGTQTCPNDPPGPLSPPQTHPRPTWARRSAPGSAGCNDRIFRFWSHHVTPTWPIGCTSEAGRRSSQNLIIFYFRYVLPYTLAGT